MSAHPYDTLTQDTVIDAVESLGLLSDLRVFPLNSYENRVYQVGIDEGDPVIAKFYRPGRWSQDAILEEHTFSLALHDHELPVVPPTLINGQTLHHFKGFAFALFRRQGGHAPELDNLDSLYQMGQYLGRIHAIGAEQPFSHRPQVSIADWGIRAGEIVLSSNMLPMESIKAYESITADLLNTLQSQWPDGKFPLQRIHGDCHAGNVLWRNDCPHFVDFDDCRMGPVIQDIWLLLSGDRDQKQRQLAEIVDGYNEFYDFPAAQLSLIETLRTLRLMNYAAWLAQRWSDPAFPIHFPWFNTPRYWGEHILELREQQSALQEPVLKLW